MRKLSLTGRLTLTGIELVYTRMHACDCSGQDRTPAWIPFRHLLNYYKPAFQAAFDAGVATTMESYSEVDGVPMASSALYLKTLLRDVMGFDGFLVTDVSPNMNTAVLFQRSTLSQPFASSPSPSSPSVPFQTLAVR